MKIGRLNYANIDMKYPYSKNLEFIGFQLLLKNSSSKREKNFIMLFNWFCYKTINHFIICNSENPDFKKNPDIFKNYINSVFFKTFRDYHLEGSFGMVFERGCVSCTFKDDLLVDITVELDKRVSIYSKALFLGERTSKLSYFERYLKEKKEAGYTQNSAIVFSNCGKMIDKGFILPEIEFFEQLIFSTQYWFVISNHGQKTINRYSKTQSDIELVKVDWNNSQVVFGVVEPPEVISSEDFQNMNPLLFF